ncbi:MAG: aminoacetone oxidase family FAD-binding enzyme, partial [Bacteroidota bacterium]|nr:aminoacetone oxidase family FAD-binding enzyme [Bacteroidota bacterium]
RFSQNDFIALVEKHGIAYHEKTLGQLFCDGSSREIISMLAVECANAGVEIKVNCSIEEVKKETSFLLQTTAGEFECDSFVIASGGLSIPKIGATNFGYKVADQFGLSIVTPYPALVPLLWSDKDRSVYGDLSGIALPVTVTCGKVSFSESMLFTHKGLSGPAILQISSYWKEGEAISIDLLQHIDLEKMFLKYRTVRSELGYILSRQLPKNFVQKWCGANYPSKPMNQISDKDLRKISEMLHKWKVVPTGTEGFEKAEVTAGGVDTKELSSKTMEATKIGGLFFIGEVVDVTGWLGGYNFQWAWSSGWAAGQAV